MIAVANDHLQDYNSDPKQNLDIVIFLFALEHLIRISRILKTVGGHALLVGMGGSGRRSLTRLAAHMADQLLLRIEVGKGYGFNEWREDMKNILRKAGTGSKPVVFLFSDSEIKMETFVEDINNVLNSGKIQL